MTTDKVLSCVFSSISLCDCWSQLNSYRFSREGLLSSAQRKASTLLYSLALDDILVI